MLWVLMKKVTVELMEYFHKEQIANSIYLYFKTMSSIALNQN